VWRYGSTATRRIVQLKEETLQRTGSFKCRGAWNRLRLLSPEQRRLGVVCASAGNHAQGVALAASLLGIKATIVMPEGTSDIKVTQTRLYGDPEIIFHGSKLGDAYHKAQQIEAERGSVFVSPYNNDAVIAGQGTIGLEIVEQWPDVDTIIVPVGGGGLIAGITVAVMSHQRDIKVIGVQAKNSDSAARSLETGRRVCVTGAGTIADGINVPEIGERPFEILQFYGIPIERVTDDKISTAITTLCQTAKLVVEPAGAASAALVLNNPKLIRHSRHIVCLLSGANIDIPRFARILETHPTVQS
jgi:threonine dehydratase